MNIDDKFTAVIKFDKLYHSRVDLNIKKYIWCSYNKNQSIYHLFDSGCGRYKEIYLTGSVVFPYYLFIWMLDH